MFNSEDFEYLGIRFRLEYYQGWTDENQEILASLFFYGLDYENWLGDINLSQQLFQTPGSLTAKTQEIGTGWHTLEFIANESTEDVEVYLDGKLQGQTQSMPDKPTYLNLVLSFQVESSTD